MHTPLARAPPLALGVLCLPPGNDKKGLWPQKQELSARYVLQAQQPARRLQPAFGCAAAAALEHARSARAVGAAAATLLLENPAAQGQQWSQRVAGGREARLCRSPSHLQVRRASLQGRFLHEIHPGNETLHTINFPLLRGVCA